MRKFWVWFDVDGTLRDNKHTDTVVANERVRTALIFFAHSKNWKVGVWSGGGELYSRQVSASLGIDKYVDAYAAKERVNCRNPLSGCMEPDQFHHHFVLPDGLQEPDLTIDDIQTFALGKMQLIVREK